MSVDSSTSSDCQTCVGFLVGGSLLVAAFLGTAGIALLYLYCRRRVTGCSKTDEEKNLNISIKPPPMNPNLNQLLLLSRPPSPNTFSNYLHNNLIVHNNTVLTPPTPESLTYIDSWDKYIAYINMIPERPFSMHYELDEKRVSIVTKQTHESNDVIDDDKIVCGESLDKNREKKSQQS
ncbi:hypothetical protein F8M41_007789 [Gigaspora margarita]|uniref:Uncharacterized protein n=1 Tax=Gigaspora margarita TaxID=4874 RepID=A0A8H4EV27_GIGMA|nr:hypothetical protein F8M41_007789 [Gigaspora margarita]